ncbi:MAG: flagellar hook protein FlgE [Deltaproteobacteria bacterium]|nr:flagellar hook protein FlgE [Deltaproteobacteria bacterium]
MSISSSIYIGTSGVMAQQESMSVISDNIANMSTVGFKSSRLLFSNLLSQELTGASVGNQIGQGVGVSSVWRDMDAGPLETTNNSMDMAISGNGFFMVSPPESEDVYYTKAGNFTFDKDGYLLDPNKNVVQGYQLTPEEMKNGLTAIPAEDAPLQDVKLSTENGDPIVSTPEMTSKVQMMVNLDSGSQDLSVNEDSPFTALFTNWDATAEEPLGAGSYTYTSALKIYDANGDAHVVTAYFDPASESTESPSGHTTWEYLLTVPPEEDGSALNTKAGILMAGTLTFSPAGELDNLSAFQGTTDDATTWTPVPLSEDGFPTFTMTLADGTAITSSLDFGVNATGEWDLKGGAATMAELGNDPTALPKLADPQKNPLSTTAYATGSSTIHQSQNGYAEGALQSTHVDGNGIIVGKFSNGQEQELYKIALADFINPQGLFREGGNLFSATKDSGAATSGWAGEGKLGSIVGSTLENSNVDLATEFVHMITTQKAFDANSKVITTSDQVVQTALGMKK